MTDDLVVKEKVDVVVEGVSSGAACDVTEYDGSASSP